MDVEHVYLRVFSAVYPLQRVKKHGSYNAVLLTGVEGNQLSCERAGTGAGRVDERNNELLE